MINICNSKMEGLVTSGTKIQMTYIFAATKDIFKPKENGNNPRAQHENHLKLGFGSEIPNLKE